ncbi:MAG: cob(I)yrinic acid a,c-diamide adenosyltransferase [Veillonellales bacterium]
MKVYTKTGDKGTTGLLTGERIAKDSVRVDAYGTVDEINSALGLARAWCKKEAVGETIFKLQKLLMLLMADLASINSEPAYITAEHIVVLEQTIDHYAAGLPELRGFVTPGENAGSAALDLARTVTRRAERRVLELARTERINENLLIVLNRLSDLCFVLARAEDQL